LIIAWIHPLLHLASIYLAWSVHWLILGHDPRKRLSGDPDSYAHFWLRLSDGIAGLFVMTYPVFFVAGCVPTLWTALGETRSRFRGFGVCAAFIMVWTVWYLMYSVDPGGIIEWWWD
jgi:hypothetical protein